jgi:hypothetical protein
MNSDGDSLKAIFNAEFACYNTFSMKKRKVLIWGIASLLFYTAPASADYTLVLKNGRRITAKSYREEGSMIKIHGLGGELGIPKDQILVIQKADKSEQQGLSINELEVSARQTPAPAQKLAPIHSGDAKEAAGSGETKSSADVEEEKEYQKRLAEITQQLESAKQQYLNTTQGGATSSNLSKEGFDGWIADLGSRIRDSQKVPGGGGPKSTPPMPSSAPSYTPREKEISDLRIQIETLQKDRDALIEEMKSKNIPTAVP